MLALKTPPKYTPRSEHDCNLAQFNERLRICDACPRRRGHRCAMDGREIKERARLKATPCFDGLWPALEAEAPAPEPERAVSRFQYSVAVVIISHNYGRFLRDAIGSAINQTWQPKEIVVVDDSSDDDTRAIAAQYVANGMIGGGEIRYVRVDARDVNKAREAGFKATTSDVVCFLDADDKLAPDYLEEGLQGFADPNVALVYSDWEYFGNRTGREVFPQPADTDIHWKNFAHCASLVKRSALQSVDAFHELPDMTACRHHCDWALWRRVLTGTRRATKQSSVLFYRQHGSNWLQQAMQDRGTYYDRQALYQEPVTIFVPMSGRLEATDDVLAWLYRQTFAQKHCRLVLLNTSHDEQYDVKLRARAAMLPYADIRVIARKVGAAELRNANANKPDERRQIVEAMWRIYDGLPQLETEYILTVEDDVIPPDDALDRLMHHMDSDVFSVASPYRGRYGHWMTWDVTGPLVTEPKRGLQPTTGNGFGCTLMRRSVLQRWVIGPYNGIPDYDMALYQRLKDEGQWRALVDWDCRSTHAGLAPD